MSAPVLCEFGERALLTFLRRAGQPLASTELARGERGIGGRVCVSSFVFVELMVMFVRMRAASEIRDGEVTELITKITVCLYACVPPGAVLRSVASVRPRLGRSVCI